LIYCTRKIARGVVGKHKTIKIRSMKNYTVDNFRRELLSKDWMSIIGCDSLCEAWNNFHKFFMDVLDEIAPIKTVRLKQRTEPWFDAEIIDLINRRDKKLFMYKKSKDEALYKEFKILRNKTQAKIYKAKVSFYSNKVEENKNKPKQLWQTLKSLGIQAKGGSSTTNIGLQIGNELCFDKAKVADTFNSFFTTVASTLVSKLPAPSGIFNETKVKNYYVDKGVVEDTFKLSSVSEDEVFKLLKNINVGKATGLDNLPAKFIRDGGPVIGSAFSHIINLSFYHGSLPNDLKSARVVPLYKKNSKTEPGNYRPVSILCVLSKIIERLVYNQLENYLISHSLLYELQSGFRTGFSTESCLIYLTDHIRRETDKGNFTGMVLLDLQKAFDTVDHTILLYKLKAIGANQDTCKWFEAYLTNRSQVTDVGGCFSTEGKITCGVPQGSILGPLLFLIYVNDMSSAIRCKLLLYADDSALLVSGKDLNLIQNTLGDELENVSKWLVDNKLSLHLGKTESILFGSKRKLKKHSKLNIVCNGSNIESKTSVKYLGVDLDQSLSGEVTGGKVIKKVNARLKFIYRKAKFLNEYCKKLLVSALIQCHMDYACASWYSGLTKRTKDRLQICQNKMIRCILGLHSRSHIGYKEFKALNWVPVESRVIQLKLNHVFKVFHSSGPVYLREGFILNTDLHSHYTRGSELTFFKPRVGSHGIKTFNYTAIEAWNSLPIDVRGVTAHKNFKFKVRQSLLNTVKLKEEREFIRY